MKKFREVIYKSLLLLAFLSIGFQQMEPLLFTGPMAPYAPRPQIAYAQEPAQQSVPGVRLTSYQDGPITSTVVSDPLGYSLWQQVQSAVKTDVSVAPILPNAVGQYQKVNAVSPSREESAQIAATQVSPQEIIAQSVVVQNVIYKNNDFENWYMQGSNKLPDGWTQHSTNCLELGYNSLQVTGWGTPYALRLGGVCDDVLRFKVKLNVDDGANNSVRTNALAAGQKIVVDVHVKRASSSITKPYDIYVEPDHGGGATRILARFDSSTPTSWTGAVFQASFSRDELVKSDGEFNIVLATQAGGVYDIDSLRVYTPFGMGAYQFSACLAGNCGTRIPFQMTLQYNYSGQLHTCSSNSGICNYIVYQGANIGGTYRPNDINTYRPGKWGYSPTQITGDGTLVDGIIPIQRWTTQVNGFEAAATESPGTTVIQADGSEEPTAAPPIPVDTTVMGEVTVLTATTSFSIYLPVVLRPNSTVCSGVTLGGWCPSSDEIINKAVSGHNMWLNPGGFSSQSLAMTPLSIPPGAASAISPQAGSTGISFILSNGTKFYWPPAAYVDYAQNDVLAALIPPPIPVIGTDHLGDIDMYLLTGCVSCSAWDRATYDNHGGYLYVLAGDVDLTVSYNQIETDALKKHLRDERGYVSGPQLANFKLSTGQVVTIIFVIIAVPTGIYLMGNLGPAMNYQPAIFNIGTPGGQPFVTYETKT